MKKTKVDLSRTKYYIDTGCILLKQVLLYAGNTQFPTSSFHYHQYHSFPSSPHTPHFYSCLGDTGQRKEKNRCDRQPCPAMWVSHYLERDLRLQQIQLDPLSLWSSIKKKLNSRINWCTFDFHWNKSKMTHSNEKSMIMDERVILSLNSFCLEEEDEGV